MKLDHYETSTAGRRRLSGRTERHGSHTGLSTVGAFAFGSVFVAAGTAIILVGSKVIPVKASSVHAPYWVLTAFGAVFALAGMMVWSMAFRQAAVNRCRRQAVRLHPNEPALADYDWDPRGFEAPRWKRALGALGGAAFLTLFLSGFNWWAFGPNGPWFVKAIVILFDLLALAAWGAAFMRLGRALKFGGSRVTYERFPCSVHEPIVLRWEAASGIHRVNKGSFTLRCVEEWWERHGSGGDRSSHMIHEELWSATWRLDQPRTFPFGERIVLRFEPPPDARPTCLSAERPVFWELEARLDLPGLDFTETYLVPVYDTARDARRSARTAA